MLILASKHYRQVNQIDYSLRHALAWADEHKVAVFIALSACIIVSCYLNARLWIYGGRASLGKRIAWSIILLIPIIGWVAYGGLYQIPKAQPRDTSRRRK